MDRGEGLTIQVPGDKSITQRALILGALADGESRIRGALLGADPRATGYALRALGASIAGLDGGADGEVRISGGGLRAWHRPNEVLDLRNSGTGARLLAGALAAQPLSAVLGGDASLRARPMRRIAEPLARMGATVDYLERDGHLPMRVTGGALTPLRHESAVASAQVKSAVLLAGVGAGVAVEVREPRRSRDHSERMLEAMGVGVGEGGAGGSWCVSVPSPPSRLEPLDLEVPGDFSSAAFFLAWAMLAGDRRPLTVRGTGLNPTRTGLLPVLERMGGRLEVVSRDTAGGEPVGDLRVDARTPGLEAVAVGGNEVTGMIDEVPVLAVLAARAEGVTRITGAEELRVKESDRLAALAANLRRIGVAAGELPGGLEIEGTDRPLAGSVESFGDHRIAMAFAVLGVTPGCEISVDDRRVADVSFPGFWALLERIAGPGVESGRVRGARSSVGTGWKPRDEKEKRCLVVAIDGSAGSGKSTTAAEVAARMGFRHLDSGAIYRAVTLALLESGHPISEAGNVTATQLSDLEIDVRWGERGMVVRARGRRLAEGALRSERVTAIVSRVAAMPAVRAGLLELQRNAARGRGLVAEGRDMGTVVFPDAEVKVFLDARPRERARRRLLQRGTRPDAAAIAAEADRLTRRDRRDASRSVAPLLRAEDAVLLDTTALDPDDQTDAIVRMARAARRRR